MRLKSTRIKDLFIIKYEKLEDRRGSFNKIFLANLFEPGQRNL